VSPSQEDRILQLKIKDAIAKANFSSIVSIEQFVIDYPLLRQAIEEGIQ